MAFTTDSLTEIFTGATGGTGILNIPSGSITSFIPTGIGAGSGVANLAFGLATTLASAFATGNYTNVKVSDSKSIGTNVSGSAIMNRNINFRFTLNYPENNVDDLLNVIVE